MRQRETRSKPPSAISGRRRMCRLMRYEVKGRRERKEGRKEGKKCTWKKETDKVRQIWLTWREDRHENFKPAGVQVGRKKNKKQQWNALEQGTKSTTHPAGFIRKGTLTCKCQNRWVQRGLKHRQMLHRKVCEEMWTGCGHPVKYPLENLQPNPHNLLKWLKKEKVWLSHMHIAAAWLQAWRPSLPSSLQAPHQTTHLKMSCSSPKVWMLVVFSSLLFRWKCETEM